MPGALKIVIAAILALAVSALAAEPLRIADPDKFCEGALQSIAKKPPREVAELIADTIGKPDLSSSLAKFLEIFEKKNFDFTKKVIDKDYNGALRQIVYYSYVENVGFIYFRFNFKMTGSGWVLANFSFKDETNELFPKDFTER